MIFEPDPFYTDVFGINHKPLTKETQRTMKTQLIETKNVMVNLDKQSRDAIETYARQNNLSRSEAIRHAISQLTGQNK